MPDQSILKTTSPHFGLVRAQAAAAAMSPPAFQTEMARSLARIDATGEAMRRQFALSDPLRDFRESLTRSWGVDFRTQARRLAEEAAGGSLQRHVQALMKSFGGMDSLEDVKASFLKRAGGFDSHELASGWTSQTFLKDLAGRDPFNQAAEQALRWGGRQDDLMRSLRQFNEPLDWSSARQILETFARAHRVDVPAEHEQAGVDSGEDEATRAENIAVVDELVASIEAQPTLQDAVNQVLLAIEKTKQPAMQFYLAVFLFPILLAVCTVLLTPVADVFVKRALEDSTKQPDTKTVNKALRDAGTDPRFLTDLRFVAAKRLRVMVTPRANGVVVGHLEFGQVVRVVEKERDFTLVAWTSEDGKAELQGWVFSRYLQRFK